MKIIGRCTSRTLKLLMTRWEYLPLIEKMRLLNYYFSMLMVSAFAYFWFLIFVFFFPAKLCTVRVFNCGLYKWTANHFARLSTVYCFGYWLGWVDGESETCIAKHL